MFHIVKLLNSLPLARKGQIHSLRTNISVKMGSTLILTDITVIGALRGKLLSYIPNRSRTIAKPPIESALNH